MGDTALIMLKIIGASVLNSVGRDLCRPDLNCNGNCACAEGLLVLTEGLCVVTLRTCTTNSSVFLEGKRLDGSQKFEHRSGLVTSAKSLWGLCWGWGFVRWKSEDWQQPTNQPTKQQKVRAHLHALLTCELEGGEWSALLPGHFNSRESVSGTH